MLAYHQKDKATCSCDNFTFLGFVLIIPCASLLIEWGLEGAMVKSTAMNSAPKDAPQALLCFTLFLNSQELNLQLSAPTPKSERAGVGTKEKQKFDQLQR